MRHERHSANPSHDVAAARRLAGNGHYEAPSEPKTWIGLPGDPRHAVGRLLTLALADESLLYVKTRNFHWNVTGPHFVDLHKFLRKQYEVIGDAADEIAERVRSLGGHPTGSMAEFLRDARLVEQAPGEIPPARDMLSILLGDHEAVIRQLRKDVAECTDDHKDAGTADLLTGIMEKHELTAWQLRSLLADDHPHSA